MLEDIGPGGLLPSERTLALRFGVARMTVRQELDRLARRGLVVRVHGKGTFVAAGTLAKTDRLTSFSEDMRERGLEPGARVLSITSEPASARLADRLEVAAGSPVVVIERVRYADGVPMAHERAYLSADRFPGVADIDLDKRSLYDQLAAGWRVTPTTADQRLSAVAADAHEADLLGISPGDPALLFRRITRDAAGEVMEFTRSLYRADRYEVVLRVARDTTAVRPERRPRTARTTRASRHPAGGSSPSGSPAAR
jgi:GntR family transcriptional regulator